MITLLKLILTKTQLKQLFIISLFVRLTTNNTQNNPESLRMFISLMFNERPNKTIIWLGGNLSNILLPNNIYTRFDKILGPIIYSSLTTVSINDYLYYINTITDYRFSDLILNNMHIELKYIICTLKPIMCNDPHILSFNTYKLINT